MTKLVETLRSTIASLYAALAALERGDHAQAGHEIEEAAASVRAAADAGELHADDEPKAAV